MFKVIPVVLILIFHVQALAYGAQPQPMDDIRPPIEKGIALLKDPQYTRPGQFTAQREKIWETIRDIFDFRIISMMSLAMDWKSFTPKQQDEFIEAFTELLKNNYLNKIQGQFHDEEIVFLGQDLLSDKKAVVKSKVLRQQTEIPMDYKVVLSQGKWRIYDINIEGISLIKNYRTQFKSILAKESPDRLIRRIREKNLEEGTDGKPNA
ncbi:ABC transporter substrate-binding protein [Desulfococcus sp.]|uniref:Tgt2/MlaC family protein n=1 Tax=Desulfococcus sp. TaxID=2025834 RepID=UPI003593F2D9